MDKTKPNEALGGRPIGKKIVAKMKRHRQGKVVDIKDWVDGRTTAEELHKEIMAQKELGSLDPAFAAYVYPQIQVSVMSEQKSPTTRSASRPPGCRGAISLPPSHFLSTTYFAP
jgi:hypothetical protein